MMIEYLPLGQEFVSQIVDLRAPAMTVFLQSCSLLGEIEGYMVVIILLFTLYSQRIAVQSTLVVLSAMTLNHLLKIFIQNPRPFVSDGSHLENWAVSARNAAELATEYSTPSGHAMAAAAFYLFLFLRIRNIGFRLVCIVAIVLTGISRPYLGVHFAEDILLGWSLGLCIGVTAFAYLDQAMAGWENVGTKWKVAAATGLSAAIWAVTVWHLDRPFTELPLAFISYLGFLSGMLLGYPGAALHIGYDLEFRKIMKAVPRVVVMAGIVVSTMIFLEVLFDFIAKDQSLIGHALRYVRYALVAVSGVLVTTYAFRRLGISYGQLDLQNLDGDCPAPQ